MSLTLSDAAVRAACIYLGLDPEEDEDPSDTLDEALAEFNLTRDQFINEETLFACGYHRGLSSSSFNPEDQVPANSEGPDKTLTEALEDGFACGLEAQELAKAPPPSLVYAARKSGDLEWGGMTAWANSLDLSDTHRLGHAVEAGSGKSATVVPAGTPVDVLAEDVEKDGVPHVVVGWDGLALLVPNPEDSPKIVSGDTEVAPEKKRRSRRRSSGKRKKKAERGPTLKSAIIYVLEGKDGGAGPLQSDGAIAGRVLKRARELGIGDKATKFVTKASRHVPYYANCYKPGKQEEGAEFPPPGRLGVENPLDHVVAGIEGRKYYLRAEGTHEERLEAIPEDIRERLEDKEARIQTAPQGTDSSDSGDDGDGDE